MIPLFVCSVTLCAQEVHRTQTSADLSTTLATSPVGVFGTAASNLALQIAVDGSARFQTIDGFGASLTDGSAWLLHDRLPAAEREQVMHRLFDPATGAGLSVLRQPIASTDLSRNEYSFDEVPAGQTDPHLRYFSAQHDDAYVFPIIREALKLNPAITVIATPWSPPAWMKTGGSMDGGQLRDEAMPAYATYLVRSVEAFRAAGVPVKYLTVQNEPLNETHDYPGTLMPASQAKRLIGDFLGPDLRKAGLDTEILAYDHNWNHPEYPIEVLSDPAAAPFIAGTAMHCYGGDVTGQDAVRNRFPDKGIWLTECSGGTWQKEAPLLSTAHLLIDATRHWAKSVVLWGIALDTDHGPHSGGCGSCRGLVTIDLHKSPPGVAYTGDFYALAQAAKFVKPGAVRIGSTSLGRKSLESVAFENPDGSIALLVLNNRTETSDFALLWRGRILTTSLAPQVLATYTWTADVPVAAPAPR
jgi:glucosylceramidase